MRHLFRRTPLRSSPPRGALLKKRLLICCKFEKHLFRKTTLERGTKKSFEDLKRIKETVYLFLPPSGSNASFAFSRYCVSHVLCSFVMFRTVKV